MQDPVSEYGVVILADTPAHERCAQWLSVRFKEANIPSKIITTIGRAGTDWQVFELSPYRRTLKIEADMYFSEPTVVMDWFRMLQDENIWVCQDVVDYRGNIITDRRFRKHLDVNKSRCNLNMDSCIQRSLLIETFLPGPQHLAAGAT